MAAADDACRHQFSLTELESDQLREAIHAVPTTDEEEMTRVQILGADGQHCAIDGN